jgi:tRNA pseudouridine55 synthase
MAIDGVLVIDKPAGKTSHDIVNTIRKIANQKKVGHTGTLDPIATGVLVILLGKATRIGRYLDLEPKEYAAEALFGLTTDTQDITGKVIEKHDEIVTLNAVDNIIREFTGAIEQIPPMVSAIKIGGQPLYKLARKGIEIERPARRITVYEFEIVDFKMVDGKTFAVFRVLCSGGTYVRTLVHDIGRRLEIGATLNNLRRTRVGKFTIKNSVTPNMLENNDLLDKHLIPMNEALDNLPGLIVKEEAVALLLNGRELNENSLNNFQPSVAANYNSLPIRLINPDGILLAIGRAQAADVYDNRVRIQPEVVFK